MPRRYLAPTTTNRPIILDVTTTVGLFTIPTRFKGKTCRFTIVGSTADVLFGDSTVVCTLGDPAAVASTVITEDVNSGGHLADGVATLWTIPQIPEVTHMSIDAGGAAKLYIEVYEP